MKLSDNCLSSINGIDPKKLNTSQNNTTIRKPSLVLISLFDRIFGRYKSNPNDKNMKNEYKNVMTFPSLYNRETLTGIKSIKLKRMSIIPMIFEINE
jgi:hypothetical protein